MDKLVNLTLHASGKMLPTKLSPSLGHFLVCFIVSIPCCLQNERSYKLLAETSYKLFLSYKCIKIVLSGSRYIVWPIYRLPHKHPLRNSYEKFHVQQKRFIFQLCYWCYIYFSKGGNATESRMCFHRDT